MSNVQNINPFVCSKGNISELFLLIENINCAGCIKKIESCLYKLEGVTFARVNFSTKRLTVRWHSDLLSLQKIVDSLNKNGFPATPFSPELANSNDKDNYGRKLLLCLGVAGFAAANVMLLSISVWAGIASDMNDKIRNVFHWLAFSITLPTVIYAGRPFFSSAINSLKSNHLNMDVPISLAVILTLAHSLYQTIIGAENVYFESAITLLFFLLIGRYLDYTTREKVRENARNLLSLQSQTATIINTDGSHSNIQNNELKPEDKVFVAIGERIPADGVLTSEIAIVDTSLITGEVLPREIKKGEKLLAGTINNGPPIEFIVNSDGDKTLLSEIIKLMENAEQSRSKYVIIADKVIKIYAPLVHILSASTFFGWLFLTNVGWEISLSHAIAVLIITCPCALGLAVPVVQVCAANRLLKIGVLIKSGDALERLTEINNIAFDKTGTLTKGNIVIDSVSNGKLLPQAAGLAINSKHPLAHALSIYSKEKITAKNIQEFPGYGIEGLFKGKKARLGRAKWCGIKNMPNNIKNSELWFKIGDEECHFTFTDIIRVDASKVISKLSCDYEIILISGDKCSTVREISSQLNINKWYSELYPNDKINKIKNLAGKTLMIGDGLNDSPALKAAHVSISPSSAIDITQNAADFIFQGDKLEPIIKTIKVAKISKRIVKENLIIAIGYNGIAVTLAIVGLVTPLIAAIAMSTSSIIVTLNSLRLKFIKI